MRCPKWFERLRGRKANLTLMEQVVEAKRGAFLTVLLEVKTAAEEVLALGPCTEYGVDVPCMQGVNFDPLKQQFYYRPNVGHIVDYDEILESNSLLVILEFMRSQAVDLKNEAAKRRKESNDQIATYQKFLGR